MGDRESSVMAEKRHLEPVGAVAYRKLSRLDVDPNHVHATGFCRSGVLPGHASDSHYSYQGSYFSYPLPCHESPELSAHWSPTEPYMPCTDGAISQQLRPEKARCTLYRQESGGLETWTQNPSYEKRKDCLGGDTLAAQEKWTHYSGHTDYIPQGWIQGFQMVHSSRVPTGCPPLVAPKPVYRNHGYCTDAGCSPESSVVLGMPAESPSKRPTHVDWTPPSLGHLVNVNCGSTAAKKAPVAESGFPPFHQSWKDTVAAPAGFSPYPKIFENLHVAPSASLADTSYPAGCKTRKSVPDECTRSPCGKLWSKPPPSSSPLPAPQGHIYQERPSACYPLPSYPLTSHEHLGLYQRSIAQAEKQKALFAVPTCKSFNFPAGEDPQLPPRTCFPPAPQNYYPGHLESYPYQALGSPLVTSPSLKASREHESHQNSQPRIPFEQRNPISACSVKERALCGGPVPSRDSARDWPRAEGTAKPVQGSFQCQQMNPRPDAFQTLCSVERPPSLVESFMRMQEAFCDEGPCPPEKGHSREKGPSHEEKLPSLGSKDKEEDTGKTQSGACIVIPDSPVALHDSCLKGDSLRSRISESLDSSNKEPRDLKQTEALPPPSSPPMPVIHNVFSLAPYRDYLEGSAEKPSPDELRKKVEEITFPRPPSSGSSKAPGMLLDGENDPAYNTIAEGSRKDPSGSCIVAQKGTRSDGGFCENYRGCLNAPVTSWQGMAGRELAKDDRVLDLSLRTEGLPDVLHGKSESLEREKGNRHGESVKEVPAKGQEVIRDTSVPALQLPQNNSCEKSNFQSSAAFLYKKFKIPKSHAVAPGSTRPQNCLFQSSSPIDAPSNNLPSERAATQQNCLPVQQSSQQVVTQQNRLPVQQSCQKGVQQSSGQVATQQNSLPIQQVATSQNRPHTQQSCPQEATRQDSLPVQQSGQQLVSRQNSLPVPQSFQQIVIRRISLPALSAKPSSEHLSRRCLKQPDAPKLPPPAAPAGSPALGEVSASPPKSCDSPAQQAKFRRYFTALHASVCTVISDSVSTSSPELLREWLEKMTPEREPKPKTSGSVKAKGGQKTPEAPDPSKGKRVWLTFKDAAGLLNQVLLRLETILFTRECPFPHVVRAGTIFIPIHVVKEQLFGDLPGASVDLVLQAHKVELRPTTLSEEKVLRELDLKTCKSRLLKLLALKQLPNIYPDLLDLHWRHCVKQQLSERTEEIQSGDLIAAGLESLEAAEASRCLQSTTRVLNPGVGEKHKQGRKCELTPQGEASGSPLETHRPIHTPKSQGPSSSAFGKSHATPTPTKGLP